MFALDVSTAVTAFEKIQITRLASVTLVMLSGWQRAFKTEAYWEPPVVQPQSLVLVWFPKCATGRLNIQVWQLRPSLLGQLVAVNLKTTWLESLVKLYIPQEVRQCLPVLGISVQQSRSANFMQQVIAGMVNVASTRTVIR
jgi:hypothetical protein